MEMQNLRKKVTAKKRDSFENPIISSKILNKNGLPTAISRYFKEKGQYPMNKVATDDIGFAIYQVDLSK